jgi:hypothetical protein
METGWCRRQWKVWIHSCLGVNDWGIIRPELVLKYHGSSFGKLLSSHVLPWGFRNDMLQPKAAGKTVLTKAGTDAPWNWCWEEGWEWWLAAWIPTKWRAVGSICKSYGSSPWCMAHHDLTGCVDFVPLCGWGNLPRDIKWLPWGCTKQEDPRSCRSNTWWPANFSPLRLSST